MGKHFALGAAVLGLAASLSNAQIPVPVGKKGLEVTLVDSDIPRFTDPVTRINSMRVPPDGSGRRFLVRQTGPLHVVEPDTGAGVSVGTYFDLSAIHGADFRPPGQALGFTSLEFHPEFATNGRFYTVHTEYPGSTGPDHAPVFQPPSMRAGVPPISRSVICVLTEWTATDPSASVWTGPESGTSRELMRLQTIGFFHPMGELRFNPLSQPGDDDYGLLYISVGDLESFFQGYEDGDPGDVPNLQRLDSYAGTFLRIDPDGSDGPNGRYGIPPSNPYASDGDPDTYGEIWAHGFRNPHRFNWDPVTGLMFAADIGEGYVEEIDIVRPGLNYGWPLREGSYLPGAQLLPDDIFYGDTDDGLTYPVFQFDHADARAVAGAFICRGCGAPELDGFLVSGDIPTGRMFVADINDLIAAEDGIPANFVVPEEVQLNYNGQRTEHLPLIQQLAPTQTRVDLRYGVDETGQAYILNKRDGVMRFIRPGPCRADVTTTNTNPGSPGFSEPDGIVDGADISFFVESWIASVAATDLTSTNVNPRDYGWGVPDGVVDGADLAFFIEKWLAGCP